MPSVSLRYEEDGGGGRHALDLGGGGGEVDNGGDESLVPLSFFQADETLDNRRTRSRGEPVYIFFGFRTELEPLI